MRAVAAGTDPGKAAYPVATIPKQDFINYSIWQVST